MNEQNYISATGKSYFISDVHLGVPNYDNSLIREKKMVKWLRSIEGDVKNLFILGDIFDMWFDYNHVAPKGYVRLLGQLAKMSDEGVDIHYFAGNHDMWIFDYFEKEIGLTIYRKPMVFDIDGKKILMGHGDGLGPGDYKYKFLKRLFAGKLNQWFFARLHPNFALGIAQFFSNRSRVANGDFEEVYQGDENEIIVQYCKYQLTKQHYDFFIFGHRHIAMDLKLNDNSRYINLGEWVKNPHIATYEKGEMELVKIDF